MADFTIVHPNAFHAIVNAFPNGEPGDFMGENTYTLHDAAGTVYIEGTENSGYTDIYPTTLQNRWAAIEGCLDAGHVMEHNDAYHIATSTCHDCLVVIHYPEGI
jgi:hypothetical protein